MFNHFNFQDKDEKTDYNFIHGGCRTDRYHGTADARYKGCGDG